MFPFSEGLAAVVNEDYKMGFIDTSGKLVIPLQFDAPFNQVFIPYGSLFRNGRAWVFSFSEDYDLDIGVFSGQPMTRTFTQIDKNGNKIPGTEVKVSMRWSGPESKEIRTYGLFCVYSTGIDGLMKSAMRPAWVHFMQDLATPIPALPSWLPEKNLLTAHLKYNLTL